MTIQDIEKAVLSQYDNGRYSPHGSDGGTLVYFHVHINDKTFWATLTLDHEVAQIRRLWALAERDAVTHKVIKEYYDLTNTFYRMAVV